MAKHASFYLLLEALYLLDHHLLLWCGSTLCDPIYHLMYVYIVKSPISDFHINKTHIKKKSDEAKNFIQQEI